MAETQERKITLALDRVHTPPRTPSPRSRGSYIGSLTPTSARHGSHLSGRLQSSSSPRISPKASINGSLSVVDGIAGQFFNWNIRTKILKELKKCNIIVPTTNQMMKAIKNFCRSELDRWFKDGGMKIVVSSINLINEESPRAKDVWRSLQISDLLTAPIIKRLKYMELVLNAYLLTNNGRTKWTDELSSLLNALINAADMRTFILESDSERWDSDCRKVVDKAFGDNKKARKSTKEFLYQWTNQSAVRFLKMDVRDSSRDSIAAACVPTINHIWKTSNQITTLRKTIKAKDICRSLYVLRLIPSVVQINEYIVKYDMYESSNRRAFFRDLLSTIYENGFVDDVVLDERIETEIDTILLFERFMWDDLDNYYNDRTGAVNWNEVETHFDRIYHNTDWEHMKRILRQVKEYGQFLQARLIDIAAPTLSLLIFTSNSCWGWCDSFIRIRFPGIFRSPFWSKVVKGNNQINIQILSATKYNVIQIKQYNIYKLLLPGEDNCLVDEFTIYGTITFKWIISYSLGEYTATLQIPDFSISENVDVDDRSHILKSIIDFEDDEI